MSKRSRVRRRVTLGAAGASMAVGLAACSSGGGSPGGDGTTAKSPSAAAALLQVHAFATAKSEVGVFVSQSIIKGGRIQSIYTGTGTLDRSGDAWSVSALPIRVFNPALAEKVLDVGGTVYGDNQALTVSLPKDHWFKISGPVDVLRNTPVMPLPISPLMVAEIASATGVKYHVSAAGNINGVTEQGYRATISGTAAMNALEASGTPAAYRYLATKLFAGRPLQLVVYLTHAGRLGAFGYTCSESGLDQTVAVLDYVSSRPAETTLATPASGVVSFRAYLAAVARYDKHL